MDEGEDRASRVLIVVWQPSSFLQAHYFDVAPLRRSLLFSFVVDMKWEVCISRNKGDIHYMWFPGLFPVLKCGMMAV